MLSYMKACRVVQLDVPMVKRYAAASDAAYAGGKGTAGYLMRVDVAGCAPKRLARQVAVTRGWYDAWSDHDTSTA